MSKSRTKKLDGDYLRYYAIESAKLATVAVLGVAAIGFAVSKIDYDKTRECNPIEAANPEVVDPAGLLLDFKQATDDYASIYNINSIAGTVYKSNAPYIGAVYDTIGSSKIMDIRKPAIASIGNLVCTHTTGPDIITYKLTQKAKTGAEALTNAGIENETLEQLVNQS